MRTRILFLALLGLAPASVFAQGPIQRAASRSVLMYMAVSEEADKMTAAFTALAQVLKKTVDAAQGEVEAQTKDLAVQYEIDQLCAFGKDSASALAQIETRQTSLESAFFSLWTSDHVFRLLKQARSFHNQLARDVSYFKEECSDEGSAKSSVPRQTAAKTIGASFNQIQKDAHVVVLWQRSLMKEMRENWEAEAVQLVRKAAAEIEKGNADAEAAIEDLKFLYDRIQEER